MTDDRYRSRPGSSPTPTPADTDDRWLGLVDWTTVDLPALALGVLVAIVTVIVWTVRVFKARKAEAQLVTSHFHMTGNGANLPFQYEITVHNGSGHPLQLVEIHFWDGRAWRLQLARSTSGNNLVIAPGGDGHVVIPAVTTDLSKFATCTYLRYRDSRNRYWHRVIDSPDFLRPGDLRRMRNQFGDV